MLPQPRGQGLGRTLRQKGHGLAALHIDQDRAIALAFPQRDIVHAEDGGTGEGREW